MSFREYGGMERPSFAKEYHYAGRQVWSKLDEAKKSFQRRVQTLQKLARLTADETNQRIESLKRQTFVEGNKTARRNSSGCGVKKTITVIVCDIVGSTELAETVPLERLQHVVYAYHDFCTAAIAKRGGHVTRYMGDDILAYFEEDYRGTNSCADRAILSATDIIENVQTLNERVRCELNLRLGISTGTALVNRQRGEQTAVGKPLHLAARLQSLGDSNTIVVCEDTQNLANSQYRFNQMPTATLKGYAKEVISWELCRQRTGRNVS